jgi:hypothetical protein
MPVKAANKKIKTGSRSNFAATFAALRAILVPYAGKDLRVVHDERDYYYLETRFSVMGRGPVMFAAVRTGKNYVSYHLMPLYMNEPLQARISPELKQRKQGKACFNFTQPDDKLFAEIGELTRLGLESFRKLNKAASI